MDGWMESVALFLMIFAVLALSLSVNLHYKLQFLLHLFKLMSRSRTHRCCCSCIQSYNVLYCYLSSLTTYKLCSVSDLVPANVSCNFQDPYICGYTKGSCWNIVLSHNTIGESGAAVNVSLS